MAVARARPLRSEGRRNCILTKRRTNIGDLAEEWCIQSRARAGIWSKATRAGCENRSFGARLRSLQLSVGCVLAKVGRLELTFQTAELRDICEKRAVATAELGYAAARELAERLADIGAVDTVAELSELLGAAINERSAHEKCRLHLKSGFDVILELAHPSPSGSKPRSTAWDKTTRMKVTAIEPIDG